MYPQLISIHILKTAGTSLRNLFYGFYGREKVFWYGIDSMEPAYKPEELENYPVIGGHRHRGFYGKELGNQLFTTLVREPLARCFSLFNYYACADEPHPNEMRPQWQKEGLDPDDIPNPSVREM